MSILKKLMKIMNNVSNHTPEYLMSPLWQLNYWKSRKCPAWATLFWWNFANLKKVILLRQGPFLNYDGFIFVNWCCYKMSVLCLFWHLDPCGLRPATVNWIPNHTRYFEFVYDNVVCWLLLTTVLCDLTLHAHMAGFLPQIFRPCQNQGKISQLIFNTLTLSLYLSGN